MPNEKNLEGVIDAGESGFVYHEQLEVAKAEIEKEYSAEDALS